ncbi:hypothetical protein STRDD12_01356 [Streptococcus sp. DD12]|nr:hypothetical protein STRDD12_01356 [Streptococcus sp. DD12]
MTAFGNFKGKLKTGLSWVFCILRDTAIVFNANHAKKAVSLA